MITAQFLNGISKELKQEILHLDAVTTCYFSALIIVKCPTITARHQTSQTRGGQADLFSVQILCGTDAWPWSYIQGQNLCNKFVYPPPPSTNVGRIWVYLLLEFLSVLLYAGGGWVYTAHPAQPIFQASAKTDLQIFPFLLDLKQQLT